MEGNKNKKPNKEEKFMLIKEELMKLTNVELDNMCKERNIPRYKGEKGKTHINKSEMIEKLVEYGLNNPNSENVESKELKEELKEIKNVTEVPEVKKEEVTQVTPWIMGNKDDFINNADVGVLIAFLDENGKPRTGKLVNRSSSRRMVKLVTEFDREFVVSYDNVLWVKYGTRWPKLVYTMLKEYKNGKSVVVTCQSNKDTGSEL